MNDGIEMYESILFKNINEGPDEKVYPHFFQSGAELKYLLTCTEYITKISLITNLVKHFKFARIKKLFGL